MQHSTQDPARRTGGRLRGSALTRRGFLRSTTAGLGAAAIGIPVVPATLDAARAAGSGVQAADLRPAAAQGMAVLQTFYNKGAGQWNTTGWWNAANALNTVVDYARRTGSTLYLGNIPQTFVVAQASNPGFVDSAYDDNGWWALTWINAYDLTGDVRYLDMAKSLFGVNTAGWTDTCSGGMVWQTNNTYKETIANELSLSLAAALHLRTPGDAGSGSYLGWAIREWEWLAHSGLINAQHLVNDGLTASCENNGGTTWTYNQGVILGGLASMYDITGDLGYLDTGEQIADAALGSLRVTADLGGRSAAVLSEPYSPSDSASDPATDPNVTQFKGIFLRNLYDFYRRLPKPSYRQFILDNAQSVIANDSNAGQFGYLWQGPEDGMPTPYLASVQSSALDAINAAIAVEYGPSQPPEPPGAAYPPGANLVSNPSGADGTDGWYLAYGGAGATFQATTYQGGPALQWTVSGAGQEDWVYTYPAVTSGVTYTFAVQLAGTGQVILDAWIGDADLLSLPVELGASFQTVSCQVAIPADAPAGQSGAAPQLQVATVGAGNVTVYLRQASVVATRN